MNISGNILIQKKTEVGGHFDNYLNTNDRNIIKVFLDKMSVGNLVYLSLQNNHLKNLDFIKKFPALWSLDVRGNYIDNFKGVSDHCLGYLAVTLNKYNYSNLFHQNEAKIGILKAEGYYEENDNYWNFIYNSPSKILNFNEEMIPFSNQKNKEFLNSNKINYSNEFPSSNEHQNDETPSSIFEEPIFDMNIKIESLSAFFKKCKEAVNLEISSSEYINFEKKKIMMIFKILNSLKANQVKMEFDYGLLKIKDELTFIVILDILILSITCTISKEFACSILTMVLQNHIDQINLSKLNTLFNLETLYLLGLYYELYSHFTQMKIKEKDNIINSLEINELVLSVNKINRKNKEKAPIYKKSDHFTIGLRKFYINTQLIKFIDKEVKVFSKIILILQHVHDYLIKTKIDEILIQKSSYNYRVFLEIHSYFMEYYQRPIENKTQQKGFTFKEYGKYQIEKLNYDFHFANLNKNKNIFKLSSNVYEKLITRTQPSTKNNKNYPELNVKKFRLKLKALSTKTLPMRLILEEKSGFFTTVRTHETERNSIYANNFKSN